MAKHHQPIWYFIDFENTNSLGNIIPKANDKVILFLGAHQKNFPISTVQELLELPCEKELVKVEGQSANNVDFHLSCYLGLYNTTAPKSAKFIIVSKDKGFDNLVNTLNNRIRACSKVS